MFQLEEEYQTPVKEHDATGTYKYKFLLTLNNTLPYCVPTLELSYE